MMIKTIEKIKDACYQCPNFTPAIKGVSTVLNGAYQDKLVEVTCENRALCDYIERYLSRRMGEN